MLDTQIRLDAPDSGIEAFLEVRKRKKGLVRGCFTKLFYGVRKRRYGIEGMNCFWMNFGLEVGLAGGCITTFFERC